MLRHVDFYLLTILPHAAVYLMVEVVRVELAELSCDSLANVSDSTLLRFTISSTEVRGEEQGTLDF